MDRETYLYELSKELAVLPKIEARQAIQYYQEYFDDSIENGKSEFEVITSLGTPSSVATQIIASSNIKDSQQKVLEEDKENPKAYTQTNPKTKSKTGLVIAFSPIIFPLMLVAYILGFTFIVVGFSLLFSFGAVAVATIIGGIASLLGSIPAAIYFGTWILMAELISAGLVLIGVGLLFYLLTLKTYQGVKYMCKKISSLLLRRKQK